MTAPSASRLAAAAIDHPTRDAGFGVYLHWPFCAAKCPYCDFNSHVRHRPVDQARYLEAFRSEIAHMRELTPGREVTSIFLGGGTPSLMEPATVAGLLDAVGEAWSIDADVEVTLEANPTSVEAERFRGYRAAGVNRVSLGVQALNDTDLKALGRLHSAAEALAAVKMAASAFERYSFDLIYARPGQTPQEWVRELEEAIGHAAEHLSLYQLTIEPGTVFEALHRAGRLAVPDEETGRALFDVTQEICARHGMPAYEISNHARPGAQSRHNLVYWRYGEYVGIGPGAHGRVVTPLGRMASETEKYPETWLSMTEKQGHGVTVFDALTREEQGDEFLVMGLRLIEGIDPQRHHALSGKSLRGERIDALMEQGLLRRDADGRLAVTPEGLPILNAVVADLAA